MPLEPVRGGSGRSWNRLPKPLLWGPLTSLQTVISSSKFLLWFAWTNEREFFCGVENYHYIQTNSHFLYTHCTTVWEKEEHKLLSNCFMLLWPITAKIRTPKQVTKPQKIAVFFHTWLASSCSRIPEYISLVFRVFWISQKISLKFFNIK